MRISHVISAVNKNPSYTRFVPLFVRQWKRLFPDIGITIIFVDPSPTLPEELSAYRQYIQHYAPPPNISTAFIAQSIRILWPALIETSDQDSGVIISDIDLIPGNNIYFDVPLRPFSPSTFISMRPQEVTQAPDQIAICYNVATPRIWSEIFGIRDVADIDRFLCENNPKGGYNDAHGGTGWFSDQELLYTYVTRWHATTGKQLVFLSDTDTCFKRLDPLDFMYDSDQMLECLRSGRYSDCHIYAHSCPWSLSDIQHYIAPEL
jgi:hypothetical protein